jgi:hypothetical protein
MGHPRSYIIYENMEFACTAVCNCMPGPGMGMMMSYGIGKNEEVAWAALHVHEAHFEPPEDEP